MILVTGGTGFIGGHLLAELAKGDVPVKALKRPASTISHTERLFDIVYGESGKKLFSKIQWVDGDIMDIYSVEEVMEGCTEVYHCAAEVSLRDEDAEGVIQPAQRGTENMVNAALGKGVKKFCHVSSVAALGLPINGHEITEDCFEDFSFTNSPYAIGKHLAEAEVWRAHAEGLNVVVVSPSIVLGPFTDVHKGSMGFFSFINKTSKFYTNGIMGFVDVKDVVAIMLKLMQGNRFNERYILSAESLSFKDVYTWVAQSLGKPAPSIGLNAFTLKLFKLIHNATSSHNKISSTMVEHATGVHIFSNKKVSDALAGYTFVPVKQSIEQTAKFFLNELAK